MIINIRSAFVLVVSVSCSMVCAAADHANGLREALSDVRNRASAERIRAGVGMRADLEYRKALVATFKFAHRVEIYLLDSSTVFLDGKIGFPIKPYKTEAPILKKREADAGQVKDWCAVIEKAITSPDDVAMVFCHHPNYGIRIYGKLDGKDYLLFETSVCWTCANYYFEYDGGLQWEGLNRDAGDLKEALEEFLPPRSKAVN